MELISAKYVVYLLESHGKTYIGCTNNKERRLRQHNGELVGGARFTRKYRPWKLVCYVDGFEARKHALQFEWAWKHVRSPCRIAALHTVLERERWTCNAPISSQFVLQIVWL